MSTKPDFLCIGQQKAGTNTVYEILKDAKGVKMPLKKELHFFDEYECYIGKNEYSNLFSLPTKLVCSSRILLSATAKGRLDGFKLALNRLVKASISEKGIKRYQNFFPKGDFISGDVTPAYSILERETVEKIKKYFPDLKVFFIIRNPIERHWSQTRAGIKFGRLNDENEIFAYLKKYNKRSDMIRTIENWKPVFGSNFRVYLFDELCSDQKSMFEDVFDFLGIPQPFDLEPLHTHIGLKKELPPEYRKILIKRFSPEIEKLAAYLNDTQSQYVKEWVDFGQIAS